MRTRVLLAVVALALLVMAAGVYAEVTDSGPSGFTVKHVVMVPAAPAEAYKRLVAVGDWWNKDHTFSGDARNLSIDPRAGGCFCERLPDGGSVRHLDVVFADPGKMLRLSGGLGPLQALATTGAMTWQLTADKAGTKVEMTYTVGGYRPGGLQELAPVVDQVLGEQVKRFQAYASR